MHKLFALALALGLSLPAAGADADARAMIAPFLDEQTFAVARLDLTKLDADALRDLGGMADDQEKDARASAGDWLGAFRKAGGKDLYVVFSLADLPAWAFVIVPLGEGADTRALAKLLDLSLVPGGAREKVGDVFFAGSAAARARLRSLKPQARPELATAFAAASDGAIQVALIPPPHLARVVEEMLPTLPKEVGGGSSQVLTHGLKWAALGLDAPPTTTLKLTLQSADATSAKALDDGLGKMLKALSQSKEVRAALPDIEKMLAPVAPKIEGDRVVLSLEGKQMRTAVGPVVRRAVAAAVRMEATERLKRLAVGMHRYVDSNQKLPAVANFDKAGKPLLSWRVHLLPYLDEQELYKQFKLDEPWDSEHNKKLIAKMPAIFRGPSRKLSDEGKAVYLAPVGKDTAFTGGADGRRFPNEFTDGTANTILLVQADDAHAVEWTKPEDLKIDLDKPHIGLGRQSGGFLVATADGTAHVLRAAISKETLRNAFTANDGQPLGSDWD